MKYQFDTCSYDELTRCIRVRIAWIRECRRFIADPVSKPYHHVRIQTTLRMLTYKQEINRIMRMRRILKNSILKNWNTNYFVRRGEWNDVE